MSTISGYPGNITGRPAKDPSLESDIAVFRRFNRTYTSFLGTLNDVYLGTALSLVEGRVLYAIQTRTAAKASEIAEELKMDPGYLSRVLGKLETGGLLSRKPTYSDGRFF